MGISWTRRNKIHNGWKVWKNFPAEEAKSSLKNPLRVLKTYLNFSLKIQESEECVDVASAKMAGFLQAHF